MPFAPDFANPRIYLLLLFVFRGSDDNFSKAYTDPEQSFHIAVNKYYNDLFDRQSAGGGMGKATYVLQLKGRFSYIPWH